MLLILNFVLRCMLLFDIVLRCMLFLNDVLKSVLLFLFHVVLLHVVLRRFLLHRNKKNNYLDLTTQNVNQGRQGDQVFL